MILERSQIWKLDLSYKLQNKGRVQSQVGGRKGREIKLLFVLSFFFDYIYLQLNCFYEFIIVDFLV